METPFLPPTEFGSRVFRGLLENLNNYAIQYSDVSSIFPISQKRAISKNFES